MIKKTIIVIIVLSTIIAGYKLLEHASEDFVAYKPVIYLYPEQQQETEVKLDLKGQFFCTYPAYNDGWRVIAEPDGTLINLDDEKEYSYLFWEGGTDYPDWDLSRGFVVKGEDTRGFLQLKLAEMGLTPEEYNEFIVYWLPHMEKNQYNLIHFAGKEYDETARLEITPQPDSILRVFMVYKPLEEPVKIQEQRIKSFARKGFTVVEWGGTEMK